MHAKAALFGIGKVGGFRSIVTVASFRDHPGNGLVPATKQVQLSLDNRALLIGSAEANATS